MTEPNPHLQKAGWLMKKGQRRFFVLDPVTFALLWFEDEVDLPLSDNSDGALSAKNSLSLVHYTSIVTKGPHVILNATISGAKPYKLLAESKAEAAAWDQVLRSVAALGRSAPNRAELLRKAEKTVKRSSSITLMRSSSGRGLSGLLRKASAEEGLSFTRSDDVPFGTSPGSGSEGGDLGVSVRGVTRPRSLSAFQRGDIRPVDLPRLLSPDGSLTVDEMTAAFGGKLLFCPSCTNLYEFRKDEEGDVGLACGTCETVELVAPADATTEAMPDIPPVPVAPREPSQRTRVAQEIVQTEETYVDALTEIVNRYERPIRKFVKKFVGADGTVTPGEIDLIFSNIATVRHVNVALLERLKERVSDDWDDSRIVGDIFVDFADQLPPVYRDYVQRFKASNATLRDAVDHKPEFASLLEEYKNNTKGKLDLESLLIMPIQRVPRYLLLLRELKKSTEEGHRDHVLLDEAMESVAAVATLINKTQAKIDAQFGLK
jgi:hypothetical protein